MTRCFLVTVQVETEVDVEKLNHDNKTLNDRCVALEDQNHRVQDELRRLHVKTETKLASVAPGRNDLRDRMLSSFDHDMALLACGRTLGGGGGGGAEAKSSSVKNLIATIEEQVHVCDFITGVNIGNVQFNPFVLSYVNIRTKSQTRCVSCT